MTNYFVFLITLLLIFLSSNMSIAENRFHKIRKIGDPLEDSIRRDSDVKSKEKRSPKKNDDKRNDKQKPAAAPKGLYNGIYPSPITDPRALPAGSPLDGKSAGDKNKKDQKKSKAKKIDAAKKDQKKKAEKIRDRMSDREFQRSSGNRFDKYKEKSVMNQLRGDYIKKDK